MTLLNKLWVYAAYFKLKHSFKHPVRSERRNTKAGSYGAYDLIYLDRIGEDMPGLELHEPNEDDFFRWQGGYAYSGEGNLWEYKDAV